MGKKRYNWKSRTIKNVEIDNSTTKKIAIDIEHHADNYDNCNAFVLPTKKRKTKNIDKEVTTTRLLSKKRRKELEKVVERKKKKLQRATLLEELAKVQASEGELQQYVSLTSIQNKGLRRHLREQKASELKLKSKMNEEEENGIKEFRINSIKGSNKKKRLTILDKAEQAEACSKVKRDPNVVGFEETSSSDSDSDTNNESNDEMPNVNSTTASENVNRKDDKESLPKDWEIQTVSNKLEDKIQTVSNKQEDKKLTKEVQQQSAVSKIRTPAVFVPVNRKPEIQAVRLKLPIIAEEQDIIEKINDNPVVIITGETGSGKTTQVPQFLYEAGYARDKVIGITEPRRVAAISMSKRVAEEMNLTEKEVSYLIRFEGNVTEKTKIKFMTDGVLLKEIKDDFLLTKYSVIILDEAHERSVHTDMLIGFLTRIVPFRNKRNNPLKLIIMSATLRIEEFVENDRLFKVKPPVITIETRQFPLTIRYNRRTSENYVKDALCKAMKIHTRLPEGGILIFLTGEQEIHEVVHELRTAFPLEKNKHPRIKTTNSEENKMLPKSRMDEEYSEKDDSDDDFHAKEALHRHKKRRKQMKLPNINLDNYSVTGTNTYEDLMDDEDNLDEDNLDEDEDEDEDINDFKGLKNAQPLWVLPFFSRLSSDEQAKVFKPPPKGCRLCVVSTNVAETSLTIPNIKYVIDSGHCKIKLYDKVTGVSTYRISYVSKAAANQRAGRANRTGHGHCYRLYSSAVYNNQFEEYSPSEIERKPIDDIYLQLKAMGMKKVMNFPFPKPPNIEQLKSADSRLTLLGALEVSKKQEEKYCTKITPLGDYIADFPVSPRYGKMLALSNQRGLMKYTVCMVAALSIQQLLIEASYLTKSDWSQLRRYWAGSNNNLLLGDLMVLMKAIESSENAVSNKKSLKSFCKEHGLRHKAVVEIRKLREQLTKEINLIKPDVNLIIDPKMQSPSDAEARLLRQIVLAGMVDQIAKKASSDEIESELSQSDIRIKRKYAYRTLEMEKPVFMSSSCVLQQIMPEWVVYQELYEKDKIYMRGVTAIEPQWLLQVAPSLCHLNEPLTDPPPRYNQKVGKIICRISGTFGKARWELPLMDVEHPLTINGIKLFAYFFLDGQVCPKLKKFVPLLRTSPSSVTKSWSRVLPHVIILSDELYSHDVMCKDRLEKVWASNEKFLLSAYQEWLPQSKHNDVALLWPPI